jgi:NADH-quinone oxidoreductase subunit J
MEYWFFVPLAALCIASAVGLVLARDPLHSALWLACCLFFLSGIFVLQGAHLIGVLQVIVYAGAIVVMFLVVIMLLALNRAELGRRRMTLFKIVTGACSLGLIGLALRAFGLQRGSSQPLVLSMGLDARDLPSGFGTAVEVGHKLFNDFPLQFEAVSLLLLVAVVGAVVVAKGRI